MHRDHSDPGSGRRRGPAGPWPVPVGIFGFRQSKAKRFRHGESDVTFDDMAGLWNANRDRRGVAGFLREPERYREPGAKVPRAILLMGPSRCASTTTSTSIASPRSQ